MRTEQVAAELREFRTAPRLLGRFVASAVGYAATGLEERIHRGLPSPYLTFILSLDGPVITGESAEQAYGPDAARHEVLLGGLVSRPAYVVQPTHQAGIQLAVHPLAARAVFGAPSAELPLLAGDGREVLGAGTDRLVERLHETPDWDRRFDLVRDFLRDRVEQRPPGRPRPELVAAWSWLARFGGTGSMDGLARHVQLSGRQLRTLFNRELGMGPKAVGRLMRFDHAKRLIAAATHAGRRADLTSVALQTGHYDHAHLDREFGELAGISPTGWLAEERRNIQAGGHGAGRDSGHDRDDAADRDDWTHRDA